MKIEKCIFFILLFIICGNMQKFVEYRIIPEIWIYMNQKLFSVYSLLNKSYTFFTLIEPNSIKKECKCIHIRTLFITHFFTISKNNFFFLQNLIQFYAYNFLYKYFAKPGFRRYMRSRLKIVNYHTFFLKAPLRPALQTYIFPWIPTAISIYYRFHHPYVSDNTILSSWTTSSWWSLSCFRLHCLYSTEHLLQ